MVIKCLPFGNQCVTIKSSNKYGGSKLNQLEHLSNSQINMLLSCGVLYYHRYILREKFPTTTSLIKGLSVHKMAERYNHNLIDTGEITKLEDLKILLIDEIESFYNRDDLYITPKEQEFTVEELKHQMIEMLMPLCEVFLESMKDVIPTQAEARQSIKIPGCKKSIMYVMDVEDSDGAIIDYKVSGKKKTQKDIDNDMGLTIYALAYYSKYKKFPSSIKYFNYVAYRTPKKKEVKTDFQVLETSRNLDDFEALFNRLSVSLKAIDSQVFLPAETGHWKCSPEYCHRYKKCLYIGQKRLLETKIENKEGK